MVCVLGGTGFVGRHLVARLAAQGQAVRVLSRQRERHRELLVLPTVDVVSANVHDSDVLRAAFADCHAVINLVGILNARDYRGKEFYRVHTELTRNVVRACQHAGVTRLLQMSALNAASDAPSHYLKSRAAAEEYLRTHAGDSLRYTIFRPSVIFGPGDTFINRFAALLKLMPGVFPLACPQARFAPVHVGDVVQAFERALQDRQTAGQIYELCGPQVYTLREIVVYVAQQLKLRRWVFGLPDGLARLQAALLEFAPGKPFSLDNYRSLQVDSVCRDNGCARLGITPQAMDAVVPRYLARRGSRARYDNYRRLTPS